VMHISVPLDSDRARASSMRSETVNAHATITLPSSRVVCLHLSRGGRDCNSSLKSRRRAHIRHPYRQRGCCTVKCILRSVVPSSVPRFGKRFRPRNSSIDSSIANSCCREEDFPFRGLFSRICHRLLRMPMQIWVKFRDTGMRTYF